MWTKNHVFSCWNWSLEVGRLTDFEWWIRSHYGGFSGSLSNIECAIDSYAKPVSNGVKLSWTWRDLYHLESRWHKLKFEHLFENWKIMCTQHHTRMHYLRPHLTLVAWNADRPVDEVQKPLHRCDPPGVGGLLRVDDEGPMKPIIAVGCFPAMIVSDAHLHHGNWCPHTLRALNFLPCNAYMFKADILWVSLQTNSDLSLDQLPRFFVLQVPASDMFSFESSLHQLRAIKSRLDHRFIAGHADLNADAED